MLNMTISTGRPTIKPELKIAGSSDNETEITKFTLAVDRDYGDGTDFFPCAAFSTAAKSLDKLVEKGQQITVVGRLKNNTWEDSKGKHTVTEIIVEKWYFAGSKKASTGDGEGEGSGRFLYGE